jgi:hypothetical protein
MMHGQKNIKLPVQLFCKKKTSVGKIPYKTHRQAVYWEFGKQGSALS